MADNIHFKAVKKEREPFREEKDKSPGYLRI